MNEIPSGSAIDGANSNNVSTPTTSTNATTTTKEKRNWFHSLTRRKKSQSQSQSLDATTPGTDDELTAQNNNNEPPPASVANHLFGQQAVASANNEAAVTADAASLSLAQNRSQRKDDKNLFQRFRKKMGQRFRSIHNHYHNFGSHNFSGRVNGTDVAGASGTTDASAEFQTQSPMHHFDMDPTQLKFSFSRTSALDEPEIVPFTHDYGRFIVKKWLERDSGPNRVMYKACSEMLGQVWYWGEISRRDAQKQLTDKPTGSFLVRDSETSGCQYTLSFRTVNITLHYRLEYRDNYWHFEELQYESIVEMIEDILFRCTRKDFVCFVRVPNEMQPPLPVILKYPLSRYLNMPHLQDLCRRIIQKYATPEEIARLPIPPKLHEYLSEKRELVFQS